MDKTEIIKVIELRSDLVLEFLEQILTVGKEIEGLIRFYTVRLDNEMTCGMHVLVPSKYEQYYRLGIPSRNNVQLYNSLFYAVLKKYPFHYRLYNSDIILGLEVYDELTNNIVKLEFSTTKQQELNWKDSILKVIEEK